MYAAAFTLDLYCENMPVNYESWHKNPDHHEWEEFPHQFVEHDRKEAFRVARKRGWKINTKTRTCICPKCVKASHLRTLAYIREIEASAMDS